MTTESSTEYNEQDSITTDRQSRLRGLTASASKTVIGLATLMALTVGGLCAWALSGMGLGIIGFLAGGAMSWYYLMQQPNGWKVTGRGLHISAVVMFFLPVLFYLPTVITSSTAETAAGAGTFIGSVLGIIIWGIVFFFLAALCGVIGYLCNRKGTPNAGVAQ